MAYGRVRHGAWALAALLAFGGVGAATAQDAGVRALVPVPANRSSPVEVAVATDRSELRIGETVEVCFQASAAGYLTLWDVSSGGQVARIFPNAFQTFDAQAMRVEGGRKYCAGKNGDPFRFRVEGPTGTDDLYALWTVSPPLQPRAGTYADPSVFAAELERLRTTAGDQWATAKTAFEIVPATGAVAPVLPEPRPAPRPQTVPVPAPMPAPVQPPAPPPMAAAPRPQPAPAPAPRPPAPPPAPAAAQNDTKLLILAMGSNVKPLTKTNQDAELFTSTVSKLFSVPDSDIRLLRDVRKAQFRDAMGWLRQKARPQDIVVIYFSGHGMQVKDPTGTSSDGFDEALVPYDMEAPNATAKDAIWSQEFARWVNLLATDNVITVIDACHSAGLYRSLSSELLGVKTKAFVPPRDFDMSPPADLNEGAPVTRAMGGVNRIGAKGVLLAAARRDQYAIEASSGSVFTMVMLKDMINARSGTLTQVFDRTSQVVNDGTKGKQTPQAVGTRKASDTLRFGQ